MDDDEAKGGSPVDIKEPVGVIDQTDSPFNVMGLGQSSSLPTATMLSLPVLLLASILAFTM